MDKESGRVLLGPGRIPQLNACLNYGLDSWGLYAREYRTAAEVLTNHVAREHRDQDRLIYPVLFLWRHHIELQVKTLHRACSLFLDRPWRAPKEHDLARLFGETRRLLDGAFRVVGEKMPGKEAERIRVLVRDLSKVDKESFVFRYPEALDGAESLSGVTHINYENVTAYFVEISDLLDGADSAIAMFADYKRDMLSY